MPQSHTGSGDPARREWGLRRLSGLTVTAVLASAAATGVVAAAAHHSTTGGAASSNEPSDGSSDGDGPTGLQAPPGAPQAGSDGVPDGVSSGS